MGGLRKLDRISVPAAAMERRNRGPKDVVLTPTGLGREAALILRVNSISQAVHKERTVTIELPVIHKVRTFSAAQGLALPPWSGLDQTLSQLHSLLRQRRGDPEFWQPLAELLQDLAQGAERQRLLPAPGAELLSSWTRDDIVQALRKALPAEAHSESQATERFARSLPRPLRTGFLLMGLAASGCSWRGTSNANDLVPADPIQEDAAQEEPIQLEPKTAPPSLDEAIDQSSLDAADKEQLRDCLAPRANDLARLFRTASPEEIAAELEAELEACEAEEERSRYRRMEPIALYKGVTLSA